MGVAFFHAAIKDLIVVVPPPDLRRPGRLWRLMKALNGKREASKLWALEVETKLLENGFMKVIVIPSLFYHPERVMDAAVHGDDFLVDGELEDLDWLDEIMQVCVSDILHDPNWSRGHERGEDSPSEACLDATGLRDGGRPEIRDRAGKDAWTGRREGCRFS